ncbi:DNA-processing protein DprA [Evansella cellulosilytica]|uniref:DNA protecting protein DprA n=1 Tax=Evansella cellulosilytica (strain ATCC 21833 / DSM 2522 / FERM P-1141 / JCM 9156 / N-4) TaxID=649639 RepID=E6TSX8_EVAC2|nr:DNA-processing protein DprA [Evansella cellulosilytica]ADU30770.1 DNA protecting protein DprA [Evansella cellulosilytica DSM 2522]
MNKMKENLLLLHYCCHGNYHLVKKISTINPTFLSLSTLEEKHLIEQLKIPLKRARQIIYLLRNVSIEKLKEEYKNKNIHYVTIFDDDYPKLLKEIFDPPWILYYQGNSQYLSNTCLSVVGTRHPSEIVYRELTEILEPVVKSGITIVSGLAIGIDSMAHELTMKKKGRTIAVLGYGLDWVYPKSNEQLLNDIKHQHLVLTEYPPYVKPQRWQFPERNRIISGFSKATFVVEAQDKSGSLITADLAVQQNRDIFALPGRIFEVTSVGTNKLIQDGAKMILQAKDILEEYF